MIVTITIPEAHKDKVIDALAKIAGWEANIQNAQGETIPNPEAKAVAAKRAVIEYIKSSTMSNEEAKARITAYSEVKTSVDQINIT